MIADAGFTQVTVLDAPTTLRGVTFTRIGGRHGSAETVAAADLGEVMGVVIAHADEPTLYVAGDKIYHPAVVTALAEHTPDVVVLNAGEAVLPGFDPILMGEEDVVRVHEHAPCARIVAVHMEALDHCTVTRDDVWAVAAAHGLGGAVSVPEDGEALTL
ncbi:hypothetical protein [Microbacterium sp. NPDC079995]|uniref:MBL fold metallo-hydrolase n=1 Tax=unclassified Microbacterium TaxID=2609290 RepID=UPI00344D26D2